MSYDNYDSSSIYSIQDSYSFVNNSPNYNTLANYYNKPECPSRSVPGECLIKPVIITPQFGGVGYSIPGFNNTVSNSNYYNLNNAYPQFCKSPCVSPSYSS